jgi:hypothetical protein
MAILADRNAQDGTVNPDRAYPVSNLLPVGLKGLSFAALLLQL